MPKNSKKELSPAQKVEIAVGLTAAAVAAAGAYFLYGSKNAEKNRKKVKSWMLSAKAEVLNTLENAQHMTKEEYEALIERVAATYASLKDTSKGDISSFKREMKDYWQHIEKSGKKIASAAAKGAATAAMTKVAASVASRAASKSSAPRSKAPAKKTAKKTAPAKKTTKKAVKKTTKKASRSAKTNGTNGGTSTTSSTSAS
jgi:hypothetical protein